MRSPGEEERDSRKWKFVTSVVTCSVVSVIAAVLLYPTMTTVPGARLNLFWIGVAVVAIPAVVALAYGFTANLYVGLGALGGFIAAIVPFLMSKAGVCMAATSLIFVLRGAYLLFRAERARRAAPPVAPARAP